MAEVAKSKPDAATVENPDNIVVVDIGKKQSRKAIRRLRKGRGKLMRKVDAAVDEVRQETGRSDVTVVVVVRKKRRRGWF